MTLFDYQGIGSRLAAQIVDGIILLALYFLVGAAMFGAFTFNVVGAEAFSFLGVYGLISFLYFVILEGSTGGTVGKKLVKIKVVRDDGSPCGFGPAIVRNLLRVIDVLPFLYIMGMILIARSAKKQRLGDRIAKTFVVKSAARVVMSAPAVTSRPEGAKKFCISCGSELDPSATFCSKCGTKQ